MLVCATAVNTLYPVAKPVYRVWDTPERELAHAVEHTLGMDFKSDSVYKQPAKHYNPMVAREYFTWSVQNWSDCLDSGTKRKQMPKCEYDCIASVFDKTHECIPDKTRDPKTITPIDADALRPELKTTHLATGEKNPYRDGPFGKDFILVFDRTDPDAPPRPVGFWFNNILYVKVGGVGAHGANPN